MPTRLDRILTLSVFHPLRKILPRPRGIRIPILMYHSISDEPESGHPYFWINTSPRRFAEHMKLMKDNDYKVISLRDAAKIIGTAPNMSDKYGDSGDSELCSSSPPSSLGAIFRESVKSLQRYVVITFDDGYADFHSKAFPVLWEKGYRATVFVPTGFISDSGRDFNGKRCLRWSEIRELAESGIQFGSHTVRHPKLRDLRRDQVEAEIKESTQTLEDKLGEQVESFSYPYAFPEKNENFVGHLKKILEELGYHNGVTTKIGTATGSDDRFFLRRIPVNSADDSKLLLSKMEGGYDWVHWLQYGKKVLKSS